MTQSLLSQQFDEFVLWRIGGLSKPLYLWDGLELFEADLHLSEFLHDGLN